MGVDVFEQLHQAIINQLERRTPPTDSTTNGANASSELTENNSVTEVSSEAAVDSTETDVIIVRIPVKSATQTTGKLPPNPVECCHPHRRLFGAKRRGFFFLLYFITCRQIGLFFS
jgi:hypothetical protein